MVKPHLKAVFQALFVVFLWATSWVLIKFGLQELPPITFAGLRYCLAFLVLFVVMIFRKTGSRVERLNRGTWVRLFVLGFLFYALTQGASFVALDHLPAVTVNLLWSFSSVFVALLGVTFLSEAPTFFQWGGILMALLGALIYFSPVGLSRNDLFGLVVAGMGVLANALSSILGRGLNRLRTIPAFLVTVVSMGAGAIILLGVGVFIEGIPAISLKNWVIILWLAVVNTAFAFTLWNHTLRTLSAFESSIINGTMLIWIPIFAVIFLGEVVTGREVLGLVCVGVGTLIVQLRRIPKRRVKIAQEDGE